MDGWIYERTDEWIDGSMAGMQAPKDRPKTWSGPMKPLGNGGDFLWGANGANVGHGHDAGEPLRARGG